MIDIELAAEHALRILLAPQPGSEQCLYETLVELRNHAAQGVDRLAQDFFDSARRYARLRGEWVFGSPAERLEIDSDRSRAP